MFRLFRAIFRLNLGLHVCLYVYIYIFGNAIVADDPGSKPGQGYPRRRDRQNYFRKIKYKLGTSNKNTSMCTVYWYIGKLRTLRL